MILSPPSTFKLRERFPLLRPLEEMEVRLVRAALSNPDLITEREEAVLRTALSLARLYQVHNGREDVDVEADVASFREDVVRRLGPLLLERKRLSRQMLIPILRDFSERTPKTKDALARRYRNALSPDALDREIRHKALVLVSGGGGGTGYVYMGAMSLLDEHGHDPALMVATSIGAVLSLFRSRLSKFDPASMVNAVRGLSWKKLFRAISTENRYGVPAALRLYLRAGIGRYFNVSPSGGGSGIKLSDLPIPTIVAVSGIRRGMLPQPLEFYERLFAGRSLFNPVSVAGGLQRALSALTDFLNRPDMLVKLHLGLDASTWDFDALDAAGFSSALPGVIHYDVLRDDARMRELLDDIFEERGLFRLADGGIVDNLPAKVAWRAVHQGRIRTRNAFVLGLR